MELTRNLVLRLAFGYLVGASFTVVVYRFVNGSGGADEWETVT